MEAARPLADEGLLGTLPLPLLAGNANALLRLPESGGIDLEAGAPGTLKSVSRILRKTDLPEGETGMADMLCVRVGWWLPCCFLTVVERRGGVKAGETLLSSAIVADAVGRREVGGWAEVLPASERRRDRGSDRQGLSPLPEAADNDVGMAADRGAKMVAASGCYRAVEVARERVGKESYAC